LSAAIEMLELVIAERRQAEGCRTPADATDAEAWRDEEGVVFARGYRKGDSYQMDVPAVGSFRFGPNENGIVATPEPSAPQDVVVDTYRRLVLPNALQALGSEVLHASAVLAPQGVIAMCARRGTGKSTTAYALSRRGYPIWADDAVALQIAPASIVAVQLPFSLRLRPESASHFAADGEEPSASVTEATQRLPLRAIFLLERMGSGDAGPVEVLRLRSHQALTALLGNAYWFSLGDEERRRQMISRYLELGDIVPVFGLRFRADFKWLDAILDGLEGALGRLEVTR
jgi:hypothetical protein